MLDRSYPIYRYQKETMNEISEKKTLFLGDSRVVSSIIPDKFFNSKNIGIVGSNPIESYYLLKKSLTKDHKVNTIFVSYAWKRFGLEYWPDVLIQRGAFMDFYSTNDLIEIVKVAKKIDPEFLNSFEYQDLIFAKLKFPHIIIKKIKQSLFHNGRENRRVYNKVILNKGYVNGIWGTNGCKECIPNETNYRNFELKAIYQFYFIKLIEFCNQNNIRLVYETLPFNRSASNKFNEELLSSHSAFTEKLQKKYPQNIFNDFIFFLPDSLFEDPHHMNESGALFYSKYLQDKYF